MKNLMILFAGLFCFSVFAQNNQEGTKETNSALKQLAISNLVQNYIAQKNSIKFQGKFFDKNNLLIKNMGNNCTGDGSNCIDAACGFLPSYSCDEISEVQEVGKACLGQTDGSCIKTACSKLPSYACDEISEIKAVGMACKGNFSGDCIEEACNKLPSYSCDEITELKAIGQACEGVTSGCIESVCKKLSSYQCDEISEIKEIAKACKGM
ncbi:MAG: hypothetical protein H6623_09060 [Bdellovibrionaceae bacterium]|nr:hypothetical protein [Pseudobdellovibrionaceae bacterium]